MNDKKDTEEITWNDRKMNDSSEIVDISENYNLQLIILIMHPQMEKFTNWKRLVDAFTIRRYWSFKNSPISIFNSRNLKISCLRSQKFPENVNK